MEVRNWLGEKYLCGCGIEIGAFQQPQRVSKGSNVTYVDKYALAELRKLYGHINPNSKIISPNIIDDGEILSKINLNSQDFIIINHVIEHLKNPISSIRRYVEILKNGGKLFIGLPDKRMTFDKDRPLTSYEHLVNDFYQGGEKTVDEHIREILKYIHKRNDKDIELLLATNRDAFASGHMHVWTTESFINHFLLMKEEFEIQAEILVVVKDTDESIIILVKG